MSASIVRHLILKDLFLLRPMIVGALIVGGIGVALLPLGETAFFVGWILLLIATVLLGIFTTAVGLVTERKDRVHLFVLTLPTSPAQYTAAKLAASAIAFLTPWGILCAAALTMVAATPIPNGLMPFLAALLLYSLCYYAAYLAVALVTDSVIWSTLVIIIGNTVPAFMIPALFRLPGVSSDPGFAGAIWTPEVLTVLGTEIAFGAAALGLAVYVRSRQRDFI
jgi:ABC-2 type transport system permease protein